MIILDTNIFIYLSNGAIDKTLVDNSNLAFPSVVKIEALGYSQITVAELSFLEALFAECYQIELDEAIVQRAIRLRQQKKMSLGDSIVAASALQYDCELWTVNEEDFSHVEELRIYNPLKLK